MCLNGLKNHLQRNNLIFKCVYSINTDCSKIVDDFCTDVLKSERKIQVNQVNLLGQRKYNAPIISNIPVHTHIVIFLKNTRKLKETQYWVRKDYCADTRMNIGKLFVLRKHISEIMGERKMLVIESVS